MPTPLLELSSISKRFPGVVALDGVSLELYPGEIVALIGENGAGKSTLMKIVAGILESDGGEMLWQGAPVRFRTPSEAAANGIAMVHQESLLAPHLSVAENIFLGREDRSPLGWVNRGKAIERATRLIEEQVSLPLLQSWFDEAVLAHTLDEFLAVAGADKYPPA